MSKQRLGKHKKIVQLKIYFQIKAQLPSLILPVSNDFPCSLLTVNLSLVFNIADGRKGEKCPVNKIEKVVGLCVWNNR